MYTFHIKKAHRKIPMNQININNEADLETLSSFWRSMTSLTRFSSFGHMFMENYCFIFYPAIFSEGK